MVSKLRVIKKNYQEELRAFVLEGCCPYCSSKKVKYRELAVNVQFGFDCLSCGQKSQYSFKEYIEFSHHCTHWLTKEEQKQE